MTDRKRKTLFVSGMHCPACEVLIKKKLEKKAGVEKVTVSLADKTISYIESNPVDISQWNEEFAELGYSFSEHKPGVIERREISWMHIITATVVLMILFFVMSDSGIFSVFVARQQSSFFSFLLLGVAASLSSCAALTGGLLIALTRQWMQLYGGTSSQKRFIPLILFQFGRIVGFALFGAVLGMIGSYVQLQPVLTAFMIVLVSLFMLINGLQMLGVGWAGRIRIPMPSFVTSYVADEQHFNGRLMPVLAGAGTFFLPCGFTIVAQTAALATGSPLTSMGIMLAFAIGTFPILWMIGYAMVALQKSTSISTWVNLFAGVFIILFSIYNINTQLVLLGLPSVSSVFSLGSVNSEKSAASQVIDQNGKAIQKIDITAKDFAYFPREIRLKKGVPVRAVIHDEGVVGCARAMYWKGLYDRIVILNGDTQTISFVPNTSGTFTLSCTMGMVPPVRIVVE